MMNQFLVEGGDLTNTDTFTGAAFLGLIMGLLAWLLGEAVRLALHRFLEKNEKKVDQPGVLLVGQLARVGVWLYALLYYAHLVPWVEKSFDPGTPLGAVFYAVVTATVAWLVGRALRLTVHRVLEKRGESVDQTAVRFLGQLAWVGVWVLAFVTYAHSIPALKDMGKTWLTSVGLASVVVGLAAQNTLGNLIAGVSLVLYRPFKIGDHLQVTVPGGQETGVVESINLGYTILRTSDERRLLIPNSLMASQTCINLSVADQHAACVVVLTLQHDANIDKARQILLDAARQNPNTLGTPVCRITNLSRGGVTVTLTAWAANSLLAPDMKYDILEAAKKQFDQAAIKIPRDYNIDPPPKGNP
jgi:small-conductance mechanosensitive channel